MARVFGIAFLFIAAVACCWAVAGPEAQPSATDFPYINVADFGAAGDGVSSDTDAIQRAVDSTRGGTVFFPRGEYVVSRPIVVAGKASLRLLGEGTSGGSTLRGTMSDGNIIEFRGCQGSGVERIGIRGNSAAASGFGIAFRRQGESGCFVCYLDDVRMDGVFNGVHVQSSTETRIRSVHLRDIRGTAGVLFEGAGPDARSYRCVIDDLLCDNPQGNRETDWIIFDSWAYSLVVDKAALLNGRRGVVMRNSSNDPSGYPVWLFGHDIECDHNQSDAVALDDGEGVFATTSWFGSSLEGCGVHVGSNFRGEFNLTNSRMFGNAQHGIRVEAGPVDSIITNNVIGDNGTQSPGRFHGVSVAGKADRFVITNNTIGDAVGVPGNAQGYGVYLEEGPAGDYVIRDNLLTGNRDGGLKDRAGNAKAGTNAGDPSMSSTAVLSNEQIEDLATPEAGQVVFNTSTKKHQGYDGNNWHDLY